MPAQKIANPTAVFSGLDKITGRIISFDVAINETVQFGALQVTPRVCYTRPPTETPNTDAFIEVDEVTLQGEVKRIFTGWMFAVEPGPARGRASDLRRLADRLQRRRAAGRRSAAGRSAAAGAAAAARAAAARSSSRSASRSPAGAAAAAAARREASSAASPPFRANAGAVAALISGFARGSARS